MIISLKYIICKQKQNAQIMVKYSKMPKCTISYIEKEKNIIILNRVQVPLSNNTCIISQDMRLQIIFLQRVEILTQMLEDKKHTMCWIKLNSYVITHHKIFTCFPPVLYV